MTDGLINGKDDGDMVTDRGWVLLNIFLSFGNRVQKLVYEFNIF
jgi:hypothetical protein